MLLIALVLVIHVLFAVIGAVGAMIFFQLASH